MPTDAPAQRRTRHTEHEPDVTVSQVEEMFHHLQSASGMIRPDGIEPVIYRRRLTDQHYGVASPDDVAHLFDHLITKCENDQQPIDAAAQHAADRLAFPTGSSAVLTSKIS